MKQDLLEINYDKLIEQVHPFGKGGGDGVRVTATVWANPEAHTIVTPLHYDINNGIHCVYQGRKTYTFAEPALTPYLYPYPQYHAMGRQAMPFSLDRPGFESTASRSEANLGRSAEGSLMFREEERNRFLNVTIEAGQCVYQPAFWWHTVYSEPGTVAVNFVTYEEERTETQIQQDETKEETKVLPPLLYGGMLVHWREVEISRHMLLFKLENWVTYDFLEAMSEDLSSAIKMVSDFFIAASKGLPLEEWVPPNGENMVHFVHRRLTEQAGVEISVKEITDLLRDIGHRRYATLAKHLGI